MSRVRNAQSDVRQNGEDAEHVRHRRRKDHGAGSTDPEQSSGADSVNKDGVKKRRRRQLRQRTQPNLHARVQAEHFEHAQVVEQFKDERTQQEKLQVTRTPSGKALTLLERIRPNGACVSAVVAQQQIISPSPLARLARKKPVAVVYDNSKNANSRNNDVTRNAFRTVDASGWPILDSDKNQRASPTERLRACNSESAAGASTRRRARMRVAICDSSPARVDACTEASNKPATPPPKRPQKTRLEQYAMQQTRHQQQQKLRQRPPPMAKEDPERALLDFSKSFKKVKRARTIQEGKQRVTPRQKRAQRRGARLRAHSDPSPLQTTQHARSCSDLTHLASGGGASNQLTPSSAAWSTPRHTASFSFEPAAAWNLPSGAPSFMSGLTHQSDASKDADAASGTLAAATAPLLPRDSSQQLVNLLAATSDCIFGGPPTLTRASTNVMIVTRPAAVASLNATSRPQPPRISVEAEGSIFWNFFWPFFRTLEF